MSFKFVSMKGSLVCAAVMVEDINPGAVSSDSEFF